MVLNIDNCPNVCAQLKFFGFKYEFKISLKKSVQEKLKPNEQLTNSRALKIFKQIKFKSDALSLLTRPLVFAPLSLSIISAGYALGYAGGLTLASGVALGAATPVVAGTLIATATAVGFVGGFMLGNVIAHRRLLTGISKAYHQQSARAAEYIKDLKHLERKALFVAV